MIALVEDEESIMVHVSIIMYMLISVKTTNNTSIVCLSMNDFSNSGSPVLSVILNADEPLILIPASTKAK
jgi:hypothetical protein